MTPLTHSHGHRCFAPVLLITVFALFSEHGRALAKPGKAEARDLKRAMVADVVEAKPGKRDDGAAAKGGRANSGDAESRGMAQLRSRLEVTDDAEWDLIAERINKVEELRRNLAAGVPGGRGGPAFSDKGKRGARAGASAHPEQEALRSALNDKLPDAEIKARLARAHEVYQHNEARLFRAQADLRAVLTVRQEAVAVMAGLLPP